MDTAIGIHIQPLKRRGHDLKLRDIEVGMNTELFERWWPDHYRVGIPKGDQKLPQARAAWEQVAEVDAAVLQVEAFERQEASRGRQREADKVQIQLDGDCAVEAGQLQGAA